MKTYSGYRNEKGEVEVTVTDADSVRPLNPRTDIVSHSPDGFEWGYEGSGPAQLALAILADLTGKVPQAGAYQEFKRKFIATIKYGYWTIPEEVITNFLRKFEAPSRVEEITDFINNDGNEISSCPVCHSDKIEWGLLEADSMPYRENSCKACESTWMEFYTWGGIDCLEIGEKAPPEDSI